MATLNRTCGEVLEALEKLGYSRYIADKRIKIYENSGQIGRLHYRKKSGEDIDIVIAGSRGEGVGIYFDCDVDKVFIPRSVMCFETLPKTEDGLNYDAEFLLDFHNVPSGYCQLRYMPKKSETATDNQFLRNIESAIQEENGSMYLRNDQLLTTAMSHLTRDGYLADNFVYDVTDGPAKPYHCHLPCSNEYLSFDDVLAFRCVYPSVVNEWCERHRDHDWPSQDAIQDVRNKEVLVVPVGPEEDKVLQWRVSLVFAEMALVHSFNDIQLKVYAALKMLAKAEFKKICSNITSYIMKNVMFWVSEKTDISKFERSKFFERIADALEYLKNCVSEEELPNYMIPGRNMLKNKMSEVERQNLVTHIDSLLMEGPGVVLRCPEINDYLNDDTEAREKKIQLREIVEQSVLSIYSLPPSLGAEMMEEMFKVDKDLNVVFFFRDKIFPKIRQLDPFDFFHHLTSKTDAELVVYFISQLKKRSERCEPTSLKILEDSVAKHVTGKRKNDQVDPEKEMTQDSRRRNKKPKQV